VPPSNIVNKPQKSDPIPNMHVVSHEALDVCTSTHKITCLDHVLLVKLCETYIKSSIIELYFLKPYYNICSLFSLQTLTMY
jgi:hypothetical protein